MRAGVIRAPGEVAVVEAPVPEPGPGQVLVRLEGCGVCGSNGPVWAGRPWFEYPLAAGEPGHEGWGVVEEVGEAVTAVEPGTRVALLSSRAFAEYDVADAASVVALPPALAGRPFPGEALACAMNVVRRSGIAPGQTVAVVGIGFLGAIVVRLAAAAGARVIAISRRAFALEVARSLGADQTLTFDDAAPAHVEELAGGALCERVVEAAGVQETLDLATKLTTVRGRLVIAGYHQDGDRRIDMRLWNWRGLDVVNAHERDLARYIEGMQLAVDAVASGAVNPDPLYTHTFPLDRLDDALDAARARPDGFLKALVVP